MYLNVPLQLYILKQSFNVYEHVYCFISLTDNNGS